MDNLQNVIQGKYSIDSIYPFETSSSSSAMDQRFNQHHCDSEEPIAEKFSKRWYYLVIALLYLGELQISANILFLGKLKLQI